MDLSTLELFFPALSPHSWVLSHEVPIGAQILWSGLGFAFSQVSVGLLVVRRV